MLYYLDKSLHSLSKQDMDCTLYFYARDNKIN